MDDQTQDCRFFASYTGVKPPVKMVNPLSEADMSHRNTFIRAYYDPAGTLTGFDKVVYGEVELTHRYTFHASGTLRSAEIAMLDEDAVILRFDEDGAPLDE